LVLEREGLIKKFELEDGSVINASSNQPREYLGQILINLGHLTEDQFAKAFETQNQTNVFLGKILALIGLVSEEVVLDALNLKVRETVLEALHWPDGVFAFDPAPLPHSIEGLSIQIDLIDIHREGEFREAAWRAIRAVFPHGQIRPELLESKLPSPPKPDSLEDRLISLLREGATIDEMALALHAMDFFLYQRLYALYRLGAIRTHLEPPKVVPAQAQPIVNDQTAPQLIQQARMWMEAGNLGDAEVLARKAHETFHTPETSQLLQSSEAALTHQLRKELMEGNLVPALTIPSSTLKTLDLTATDKYLLSRIDGVREVTAIVRVSPLQELEALKSFHRFVASGLVRLSRRQVQ
jgi:hypothetical protein